MNLPSQATSMDLTIGQCINSAHTEIRASSDLLLPLTQLINFDEWHTYEFGVDCISDVDKFYFKVDGTTHIEADTAAQVFADAKLFLGYAGPGDEFYVNPGTIRNIYLEELPDKNAGYNADLDGWHQIEITMVPADTNKLKYDAHYDIYTKV